MLEKKTGAVLLTRKNVIDSTPNQIKLELSKEISKNELSPNQWARLIKHRVDEYDCVKRGWILEGFPTTRAQAIALQTIGVLPKHTGKKINQFNGNENENLSK